MNKNKIIVIAILFMLFLFASTSVYANIIGWERLSNNPTPPAYAGRVYTRHHYTTFEVNEGAGYRPITYAYCPVFDLQGDFSQGYTAVDVDSTDSTGQNYQEDMASYLCSILGVPQSGKYWIASPAYWKSHTLVGTVSPTAPDESSEAIYDIPVTGVQNSQGVYTNNDLNHIVCFNNGPNGFEAGAYGYDNKPYHWYSLGTKSPIALTEDAAKSFFTTSSKNTSEADIKFSYIYGITLSGLQNSGTKYTATVFNTTPYLAKNVNLRAYIVQNGQYTLAASTKTDIGPVARGNGSGGILQPTYIGGQPSLASDVTPVGNYISNQALDWTFDLSGKIPSGQYQVLVTANISVDQNGNATPEPLTTTVAYGNSLMDFLSSELYGTKMEVASMINKGSGLNVPSGYADNYVFSGQQQGTSPGSSSGSSTNGANDLAVTDVQVTDKGNNVKDIKSTFVSSFNVGGYATIRLYDSDNGNAPHFLQSETIHLKANDTYTIDWGTIQIGSGQYSFIVSIDYYYDDNIKNWDAEQFKGDDGKNYTEQDYSNNKKSVDTTGSDISYQPANIQESQSAWYPRLKTVRTPIYNTVTTPVYGWKKVPYIKDQAGNIKPITRIIK